MKRPRLVVAGTHSGVGKSTVTLGLMAAFRAQGLTVQGFKVGPDYLDPTYHTAITGRPSRNLDTWMMPREVAREVFDRASANADLSIIEGVMGMYDGRDSASSEGSAADISRLLEAPVLLVVDASSMARSAAAIVLGFQKMETDIPLAGVVVNRVAGERHYDMVKTAIEQVTGIPVWGYLTRQAELALPERHLGLIPAIERGELSGLFEQLAETFQASVDLPEVLASASTVPDWVSVPGTLFAGQRRERRTAIAVARDSAFNFYYAENLELLEWFGAELLFFSPLAGEVVPEQADGLYLGGGFPEEFASTLAAREQVAESVRRAIAGGMPTFAECGGYMYLAETLFDRQGRGYPMTGVLPFTVRMQEKLAALGYREVTAKTETLLLADGEKARGHEFHYSTATRQTEDWPFAYETAGLRGRGLEGYATGWLLAGYTHLHFASFPDMARRFVEASTQFGISRRDPARPQRRIHMERGQRPE
ncbi:cobyrinate a,c-diamide synthase [Alicyclobacillus sp. SP_1]|jgi:cobyrinic acid a,c-diamide synthase|uniref:cobyrinate a,c-diamide synthase n=1 Tax=Alicyclobacillus sp. SP_1 TaxID=2942475 RepID=UPI0021571F95|nr:cobyrinate a,c-diamide synthase [Alicyclobacillus sp. SP_1]